MEPAKGLVIRYLARAFVDRPATTVSAQYFADFANALGDRDLIPQQALELRLDGQTRPRVMLATLTGEWRIVITGESVDVEHVLVVGRQPVPFKEFCERSAHLLERAIAFVQRRANRVAVVTEGLAPPLPEDAMQACARKLLRTPEPFASSPPFEWDWRVASHVERQFGNHVERTNTLAIMKRLDIQLAAQAPADRLWVSTDVNTSPKNAEARFDGSNIASFLRASPSWHAELRRGLLEFLDLQWTE